MADVVAPRRPPVPRRPSALPEVNRTRCTGCGHCVAACDLHLLSLEVERWKKFSVLHESEGCSGCGLCAAKCPFDAIKMKRPARAER